MAPIRHGRRPGLPRAGVPSRPHTDHDIFHLFCIPAGPHPEKPDIFREFREPPPASLPQRPSFCASHNRHPEKTCNFSPSRDPGPAAPASHARAGPHQPGRDGRQKHGRKWNGIHGGNPKERPKWRASPPYTAPRTVFCISRPTLRVFSAGYNEFPPPAPPKENPHA